MSDNTNNGSFPVHLVANKKVNINNNHTNFGVFTLMGRYVHKEPDYKYLVVLDDIQNIGHILVVDVAHNSSYMVMVTNLSEHGRLVTISQGQFHHEIKPHGYQPIYQEPFNLFLYGKSIDGTDVVVNITIVPHSQECSMDISYSFEPFTPATEEVKKETTLWENPLVWAANKIQNRHNVDPKNRYLGQ